MLIGLTGRNASGKGEVALYLQQKSFYYCSLSDVIRDEIRNRGTTPTRELMIDVGNELRSRFGADVLAQRVLAALDSDKHYVIDSIRNPTEVEALRGARPFRLMNVEAPAAMRFERSQRRGRAGDPDTLERFMEIEKLEESGNAHSQNLLSVEAMADLSVTNDSTLEALHHKLDTLVPQLLREEQRPSWDDYFMNIAKVVASRSNCIKRKVAAVIVKDKRIISTGYNGTPRGTKNCNEGGCPRCNGLAASGTALDECYCSHGEENAIVQASYHGVSLKDSIIYTTFAPCLMCTKMIINSGIAEVIYNADYPLNDATFRLYEQAGLRVRKLRLI